MIKKVQNFNPEMLAEADSSGWLKCPHCNIRFKLTDQKRWTGYLHTTCGQRIKVSNLENQAKPVWCVVANVAENVSFGNEHTTQKGTKHFSPGTKVYCYPPMWGDGYENIKVIARHRGSNQFVTMVTRANRLLNYRAKLVYNPHILNEMSGTWDGSEKSKQLAFELARVVNERNSKNAES